MGLQEQTQSLQDDIGRGITTMSEGAIESIDDSMADALKVMKQGIQRSITTASESAAESVETYMASAGFQEAMNEACASYMEGIKNMCLGQMTEIREDLCSVASGEL